MDKDKIDEMCKEDISKFRSRKKELEKYTFVTHETVMNGYEFFTAIFEEIIECNCTEDSAIEQIILSHSTDLITIFKKSNVNSVVVYDLMKNGHILYRLKRLSTGVLDVSPWYTPVGILSENEFVKKMLTMYIDLIAIIARQLSFPTKQDCLSIIDDTILVASRANINPENKEAKDRNVKNINILKTIRRAILNYYK